MRRTIAVLMLILLEGCASIDSEQLQRTLEVAYAYNQATVQPRVDALNAMSMAQARTVGFQPSTTDSEWDWDQFHGPLGLVWACRGVQSGQFADESRCAFKLRTDLRWPDK